MSLRLLLAFIFVTSASLAAVPATARAQRTLTHDTLSGETPTAITCGFCAGEKFGTVFRELPMPARGLDEADFPIIVDAIQVALASADVLGAAGSFSCSGSVMGGQVLADVEAYTGATPPTGDIRAMPMDGPWPGETLVYAGAEIPLDKSIADSPGSASYDVQFNRLLLDDGTMPIIVDPPNTYVRVVVKMLAGTRASPVCTAAAQEPTDAFPVRDDNAVIAPERSFIYANGAGWFWSEAVPGGAIGGDWAIRLEITALGAGGNDGGPADAGAGDGGADGGASDAGVDGGTGAGGGGCSCEVAGGASGARPIGGIAGALVLMMIGVRRRRSRR